MNALRAILRRGLPVALLLAVPATAGAHTVISGVGDYFSGVLHPFTTPAHLLLLLGLGLMLGQHAPLGLKTPLAVFLPLSALALALTTTGLVKTVYPPVLIILALLAGALVALARRPPPLAIRGLFGVAALALGLDSAADNATGWGIVKTLLGTWTGLIILLADTAYYSSRFTRWQWQRVGLRVAGSWITAAALMILAFALRR